MRSAPSRPVRRPGRLALSDHRATGRVEVAGLTWRPYGRKVPVLRDLDLTIEAGERVLLVGPSGSGKSTLLRALAGLLETADAGELSGAVTLDDAAPGDRPGAVGLVLQEPGAGVVAATVARDVAFGPENVGMPRAEMPGRVASALAAVRLAPDRGAIADSQVLPAGGVDEVAGLEGAAGAWPTSALSGGQTQRLALAGALALEPSLLLLDEPTAMLDAENAQSVRAAVDEVVTARGLTLVVVEHLLGPWVDFVDRLVVLDEDGAVVADGPVRETLDSEGERLLAMGVWVPGAAAPTPIEVDPALVARASTRHTESALAATELTVARTTRTVDGVATTRVAARTSEPLVVGAGQLHALVGPSGSGKSTILHALAGFLTPTTGRVETGAGAVVADLDPQALAAHVAWVPQWSSSTVVARTVLDEVLVTAQALGRLDAGSETRARALLDVLGLGPLASADPRQLSGGEQRRLAVAAALFHGPELVLADEPTVGQDRHTWAAVVGLLAAFRSVGGAIVTATHDAHVITRAGDRVQRLTAPPAAPGPQGGEPLLAGRGPLALLLGSALAVPAGVLSPGWRPSLVLLGIQLVLAVVGLVSARAGVIAPLRALLTRLVPGLLAAVSVAWSTWLLGGRDLALAGNGLTRVLLIVLPSAVLLPFIDTDRLGDQLAQTLHLPDRPVVAVSAAMHRMQSFGQIWEEIARARRIRGLAATWRRPATIVGHVLALTIGLLLRALRSAAELAVAMDARGFARAQRRTWFHPAHWTWGDTALVALSALPALVAVAFVMVVR